MHKFICISDNMLSQVTWSKGHITRHTFKSSLTSELKLTDYNWQQQLLNPRLMRNVDD